jgi:hypothetical protein
MIDACVELNDSDRAAALYQRLVPYSGQMLPHAAAVRHVRAILSKTHTAKRTEATAFATEHNLHKDSILH